MLVQTSCHSSDALQQLIGYFTEQTRGNRNKPQTEQLRRHWGFVLLNLSRVSLQHRWLLVALGPTSYRQDYWLQRYKLSYRIMVDIVGYLEANDLIVKKNEDLTTYLTTFETLGWFCLGLKLYTAGFRQLCGAQERT